MTTALTRPPDRSSLLDDVTLVDLLDRLIGTGVVLAGDITISMAGVDLVRVSLRALVATVSEAMEVGGHV